MGSLSVYLVCALALLSVAAAYHCTTRTYGRQSGFPVKYDKRTKPAGYWSFSFDNLCEPYGAHQIGLQVWACSVAQPPPALQALKGMRHAAVSSFSTFTVSAVTFCQHAVGDASLLAAPAPVSLSPLPSLPPLPTDDREKGVWDLVLGQQR